MLAWQLLDSVLVPAGSDTVQLWQRGTEFSIRLVQGGELMNSRVFGSERALAELVRPALADRPDPRVLVGGLGLGHTLAAALQGLPERAVVVVAELLPAVVQWNQTVLGHLAGHPLADSRVVVHVGDVAECLRAPGGGWDAILLDVDNGPDGLTRARNDWLYGSAGLATAARSLRPGGVLGVWSAHPSDAFAQRLRGTSLQVSEHRVHARAGSKGPRHVIWLAQRRV
jgi:spermidine synthase